jgi:hypothetical protein
MTATQTCPRRLRELGPWTRDPDQDTWIARDGQRCCSFCGSLEPAAFLAGIARGDEVIPTDKNYKAYIGSAHRKFYFQHLDEAQQQRFIDLYAAKTMHVGVPGYFYRLPFFMRVRPATEGTP